MAKKFSLILFLLVFVVIGLKAQDTYQRNSSADIQSYIFNLSLNDSTNRIEGEAEITVDFNAAPEAFALDLIGKSNTFGMKVTHIFEDDNEVNYTFENNKIKITPSSDSTQTRTYKVAYHGIPERGLVIDTTKFGKRSFFGDNWPNLARHWLPSVDHPYDKASIEFRITAPEHYDVVATGEKIEESYLDDGHKLTIYKEPAPVAMKVVTIGVAQFASRLIEEVYDIPVTAWVYPENRLDGFSDYSVASEVLKYFIDNIGPYSYAKLANKQAKTQWDGLENARTISYFENSVNGKNEVDGLSPMRSRTNGSAIPSPKTIGTTFGSAKVLLPILQFYIKKVSTAMKRERKSWPLTGNRFSNITVKILRLSSTLALQIP